MANNIPNKMRGVQLTGYGDFEKLVYSSEIPLPTPKTGDVLIKVSAAGVNNTDINTRVGWYSKTENKEASWSGKALVFPRIQGADVCGKVVAVGDGVDQAFLNERVLIEPCLRFFGGKALEHPWYLGSECDGGFSEYCVVSSRHAYKINSKYSDVELASFPCSYSTAENLLTRAKVVANDVVLVTGASGGVGSAAVQLARARGARVIGVANPSKSEELLRLGAEQVISRGDNIIQALGENSVDVVIDLVGGERWADLLDALKPFGRYAVSGAIAGAFVELDLRTLYLKDISMFGGTVLDDNVFANLVKRIEAEEIKPVISGSFPLTKIVEAQKQFALKQFVGKLVLNLSSG